MLKTPPHPRNIYREPACRKRVSGDAIVCAAATEHAARSRAAKSPREAHQASNPILASGGSGRAIAVALRTHDLPPRPAMGGHRLRFLPWLLRAAFLCLCPVAGSLATF